MYCAECGTANPIGAETCEVCGSPLGPSSGEKSCHVCGAPIDVHDRFCRACGQSQSGADAGRFEPGPSFVDDSSLEVEPSELPPWLRDMTQSAAESENGHVAAPAAVAEEGENLPPWLDSAPPANGTNHTAPTSATSAWSKPTHPEDEPAESFSLISEDDLPEWLRALGDQEFDGEQSAVQPAAHTPVNNVVATAIAPTVSRAWLSRSRGAESETAEEIAADFAPLESGPVVEPKREPAPQTDDLTLPAVEEPVAVEPEAAVEAPAQSDTRRVRIIMLSVVVLLVVILGYYAVSNFL